MNKMLSNEKEVLQSREKIFNYNKFNKYEKTIDKLQIPKIFDYKNCIPIAFSMDNYSEIKKFKVGEYQVLYKEMKNYIRNEGVDANRDVIVIVHPFYPTIRHANFLIEYNDYFKKYIDYEEKITNMLESKNSNIVLFESPDNFARYTYKFYDNNSIKNVVFTEHSNGKVLDKEDLKIFSGVKRCIIMGCYGQYCLKDVKDQLEEMGIDVICDKELILERAIEV